MKNMTQKTWGTCLEDPASTQQKGKKKQPGEERNNKRNNRG